MSNQRVLTEDDLQTIKGKLVSPKNVDVSIFQDFVEILMSSNAEKIIGVEVDSNIKSILADRERMEKERLARVTVALSSQMKEAGNFPSERKEPMPKYFNLDEIDAYLQEWTAKLQNEIYTYFNFNNDQETISKVKDKLEGLLKITPADAEKKNKIKYEDLDILASSIVSNGIVEFENELYSILSDKVANEAKVDDLIKTINSFNDKEVHLNQNQLNDILDSIKFAEYYKGGANYDEDLYGSRMMRQVDLVNQKQIKRDIRNQLIVMKFNPKLIKEFTETFKLRFERSLTLEGKFVGNIMAAAIGESSTQQTLNTFHVSGDRKGRSQITGFQKLKGHLEASDNPSSVNNVIFTKNRMSEEEMFLKASNFEYCVLANLIQNYKIIEVKPEESKPKWEKIHDAVFGIGRSINHTGDEERFNLHRDNPLFSGSNPNGRPGYILQIELIAQELFFRRLTVGMVAHALEQNSGRLIRVSSSSAKDATINVYFNFKSIPDLKVFKDGSIPSYVNEDPFRFALENVIYKELKGVRISGIPNLTYFSVKNFRKGLAVNFPDSYLEISNPRRRLTLTFVDMSVVSWGLTEDLIKEFILISLAPYALNYHDFNFTYSDEDFQAQVDTKDLVFYDTKSKTYDSINMNNIQEALISEKEEILMFYAIQRDGMGIPMVEKVSSDDGMDLRVSINPKFLNTTPDTESNYNLGVIMDEIGNTLAYSYSLNMKSESEEKKETYRIDGNVVVIKNFNDDISMRTSRSFGEDFLDDCATLLVKAPRLDIAKKRFYYLCEGRNFEKILSHPLIDSTCSRTDSSVDVYNFLGVESARTVLVKEIRSCVSDKLNPVHVDLMADSLTARTPKNKPLAQHFHGNSAKGTEFFSRSFQQATDTFMKSYGSSDHLRSFAGQVIASRLNNRSVMNKSEKEYIMSDPDVFGVDYPSNRARFNPKTGLMEDLSSDVSEKEVVVSEEIKVIKLGKRDPNAPLSRRRLRRNKNEPEKPKEVLAGPPLALTIYGKLKGEIYNPTVTREGNVYFPERSFFISSLSFLNSIVNDAKICIIAGASPGTSLAWLSRLFPATKFIVFDKKEIEITPIPGVTIGKAPAVKNISEVNTNIVIVPKRFDSRIASELSYLTPVFISNYKWEGSSDANIMTGMIRQYNWVKKLKPLHSSLTFKHPHRNLNLDFSKSKAIMAELQDSDNEIDFISNYQANSFKYFFGQFFLEPWGQDFSFQCRLFMTGAAVKDYDNYDLYEQKLFDYNKNWRQNKVDMINVGGLDGCGDCQIELDVWKRYISRVGGEIGDYISQTQKITNALHGQKESYDFEISSVDRIKAFTLSKTHMELQQIFFEELGSSNGSLIDPENFKKNPFITEDYYITISGVKDRLDPYFKNDGKEREAYENAVKILFPKTSSSVEKDKFEQILDYSKIRVDADTNFLCLFTSDKTWVNYMMKAGGKGTLVTNVKIKNEPGLKVESLLGKKFGDMLKTGEELMRIARDHRDKTNLVLGLAYIEVPGSSQNEKYQELYGLHLIMREIIIGIFSLSAGGNLIVRIFDSFTEYQTNLIYLCTYLFEEVTIIKPQASKPNNAEKFLVAKRFIKPNDDQNYIPNVLGNFYVASGNLENTPQRLFKPDVLKSDPLFINLYSRMIEELVQYQSDSLKAILTKTAQLLK